MRLLSSFLFTEIQFQPHNDVRSLEIENCHIAYLQTANYRLIDPIDEREFHGLTIAYSKRDMAIVKKRLRELVVNLLDELSASVPDVVLRIQAFAFKITKDSRGHEE